MDGAAIWWWIADISKPVISVGNLVTCGNFGSNFLVAARLLCYMIFTGKYGNINFNMKITFLWFCSKKKNK